MRSVARHGAINMVDEMANGAGRRPRIDRRRKAIRNVPRRQARVTDALQVSAHTQEVVFILLLMLIYFFAYEIAQPLRLQHKAAAGEQKYPCNVLVPPRNLALTAQPWR